jgi:hypothetical protein
MGEQLRFAWTRGLFLWLWFSLPLFAQVTEAEYLDSGLQGYVFHYQPENVVIKIAIPSEQGNGTARSFFRNEVIAGQVLSTMIHQSHLNREYGVSEFRLLEEGRMVIGAKAFVEGVRLDKFLRSSAPENVKDGVRASYSQLKLLAGHWGIIDLSPENVMYETKTGKLIVIDSVFLWPRTGTLVESFDQLRKLNYPFYEVCKAQAEKRQAKNEAQDQRIRNIGLDIGKSMVADPRIMAQSRRNNLVRSILIRSPSWVKAAVLNSGPWRLISTPIKSAIRSRNSSNPTLRQYTRSRSDADHFDRLEDHDADASAKRMGDVISEEERRSENRKLERMTPQEKAEYKRAVESRAVTGEMIRNSAKK